MTNSAGAGIKTILPVRKNAPSLAESQATTPTKRKSAVNSECRNTKRRPRKYKTGYGTPYKRRLYGNSSDSEPEPSEKRSLHNNMERQRRIDLRNAFEDLRQLIPEVSKKDRAAKVLILKEASQYCDNLTRTSINQQKHMEDLKRHQEWLRNRVSQLRRSLAAKR
nr:unnamed protein product [Callosobruchus chinensis]